MRRQLSRFLGIDASMAASTSHLAANPQDRVCKRLGRQFGDVGL